MNFQPMLAAKVADKSKTVTRRRMSSNPRSPWFSGGCSLKPGQDYAVCPGRGKNAIARVLVTSVTTERLGDLDDAEARLEGFDSAAEFEAAWMAINNSYDADELVWRIEFTLVEPDSPEDTNA